MNMCKTGLCEKYRASTQKKRENSLWYGDGKKYCCVCGLFVFWEGRHCPCCGHKLRLHPRTKKYKELRETARIG